MSTPQIKYSYADVPTIARFAESDARIRGIMGPFRSGKSSGSVIEIIRRAQQQRRGNDGVRRSRWIVVRNTFAQLEDSTIQTTMMWLPPQQFGTYTQRDHSYTVKAFPETEFEIWFRALDRPDHVRNLLSVECTGAWFNEAREIPWSIVEAMDGRIGQYPAKMMGGCSWEGMWLDTNPPDTDSKWYRYFEEREHDPSHVRIFKQPSGLSPQAENISGLNNPNYYRNLAYGKDPDWVKVYIEGEYGFVMDGKPIYPEYADRVHCKEVDPVPGKPILRGWDFGLTPACVFCQELPDGRFLVFDEMVSDNMGIDEFSDEVIEHCNRSFRGGASFEDWGDPAGQKRVETDARSAFEILHNKRILIEPSIQSPAMRWESVKNPLRRLRNGEPMFVVHPRCKTLRKGFQGGYHRRRLQVSGPDRFHIAADKNEYSHPHDALQYVMVKLFAPVAGAGMNDDDEFAALHARVDNDFASDRTRSNVTGY